jgi:D-methionine transport system ATP-binding protein
MIAFQHVSVAKAAPGGRQLWVEDVSFTIETGEIFGIAGQEGAGKSTLLRTVNGLVTPSRGEVVVDGLSVTRLNGRELSKLRRHVGVVLPSPALMNNLPLRDSIALPLGTSKTDDGKISKRVEELLALTEMEGLGGAYPGDLSIEQQKRGAIARALASNPKILLCMEPTLGLTPADGECLLHLLARLHKELQLTLVLSTRDLHVIKRLCGRAAIMQNGKVAELNDTYSLFSTPQHPFTRDFLNQQLSFELPPEVEEHACGTIVCIEYKGDPANEPVLYETAQRFGAEFNILQGRIEYIGGKPLGKMYVSFNAEPALMVSVLEYLKAHSYRAEVIQDV